MSIASSPASACALPLAAHFSLLQDPRVDRTKQHLLLDIVVIAFCAVLCGAEGWEDMEEFGRAKHAWLKERLELPLPKGWSCHCQTASPPMTLSAVCLPASTPSSLDAAS